MELLKVLVEAFIVDLLYISFSQNIIYIIIFVKKKLYIFKLNDIIYGLIIYTYSDIINSITI